MRPASLSKYSTAPASIAMATVSASASTGLTIYSAAGLICRSRRIASSPWPSGSCRSVISRSIVCSCKTRLACAKHAQTPTSSAPAQARRMSAKRSRRSASPSNSNTRTGAVLSRTPVHSLAFTMCQVSLSKRARRRSQRGTHRRLVPAMRTSLMLLRFGGIYHVHGISAPYHDPDNPCRTSTERYSGLPISIPIGGRTLSTHERKSLSRASRIIAAAIGLAPAAVFAAGSCPVNLDDVKAKISSCANKTDSEDSGVKKDFEAATNKDYAKKFFDTLDQLNKAAKDSTQLVNTAYNLAG